MNNKVAIIGTGLSGLTAALQLEKNGFEVTLLESSYRAGGRIYTHRLSEHGNHVVELGAYRIPDTHQHLLAYVDQFDLPLRELTASNKDILYHVNSQTFYSNSASLLANAPLQQTDKERETGLGQLLKRSFSIFQPIMQNPQSVAAQQLRQKYSQYSVVDFLKEQNLSDSVIALFAIGMGDVCEGALLDFLRHFKYLARVKKWYTLKGGMDTLTSAFLKRIKGPIHFNTRVESIRADTDTLTISGQQGKITCHWTVNQAVLALPCPSIRQLTISPPLSQEKNSAIRELNYANAVKAIVVVKKGFYLFKDSLPCLVKTDHPMEIFIDNMDEPELTILTLYIKGKMANKLDHFKHNKNLKCDIIYEALNDCFPSISSVIKSINIHHWCLDSGLSYAYSFFKPGQFARLYDVLVQSENSLHFAGDYASPLPGWAQGAILSGERVAKSIQQQYTAARS